jgi:hypothetical protein
VIIIALDDTYFSFLDMDIFFFCGHMESDVCKFSLFFVLYIDSKM